MTRRSKVFHIESFVFGRDSLSVISYSTSYIRSAARVDLARSLQVLVTVNSSHCIQVVLGLLLVSLNGLCAECGNLSAFGGEPVSHRIETLGDLTTDELVKIQAFVDRMGPQFTLYVVGSATRGARRKFGPYNRLTSDIDYVVLYRGEDFDQTLKRINAAARQTEGGLPNVDPRHGVLISAELFPGTGPAIRFRHGEAPDLYLY